MQPLSRRSFATFTAKSFAALGIGSLMNLETACTFGSVWAEIQKYIPVGLSAFAAILSILTGSGIGVTAVSAIVALVKTGFADLSTAVSQYQDAPTGQKTGLLGGISEAITVVEANLQSFWANLSIPDAKLAATIQGLLEVLTTTLAGFATQLPAPVTPVAMTAMRMKASLTKQLSSAPVKRSPGKVKADFNAQLKAGGFQQHAI